MKLNFIAWINYLFCSDPSIIDGAEQKRFRFDRGEFFFLIFIVVLIDFIKFNEFFMFFILELSLF